MSHSNQGQGYQRCRDRSYVRGCWEKSYQVTRSRTQGNIKTHCNDQGQSSSIGKEDVYKVTRFHVLLSYIHSLRECKCSALKLIMFI